MVSFGQGRWRGWACAVILGLMAVGAAASFLPLIDTTTWWIRYLDFSRLQIAIGLIVLAGAFFALRRPRLSTLGWAVVLLAVPVFGYNAYTLYPYGALAAPAAVDPERCPQGSSLAVMVANVRVGNEQAAGPFLSLVSEVDPDLLLVIETDGGWDRRLAPLDERFPERARFVPDGHGAFGMQLLSKARLISPEFRFLFDGQVPTAFTGVQLANGDIVQFVGLHPPPPLPWSEATPFRDASILVAAMEAGASGAPTIVAGDFNAVPWEAVTRRAARIGGLLDPRRGRGLYPTFTTNSLLISWPLDHILFQEAFTLLDFEVLPDFGSDHYPIMARLCHGPGDALLQSAPELEPDDVQEAKTSIEAARR